MIARLNGAQAPGLAVLSGAVAAFAAGAAGSITFIDLVVSAVPLALVPALARVWPGLAPEATVASGVLLVPAFGLPAGTVAGLLVLPWAAVTGWVAIGALRHARHRTDDGAFVVVAVYLGISAGALVASRTGTTFGHLVEPIVELTAVHYGFAGAGAVTLAALARRVASPRRHPLAGAALVTVAVSAPVIALGFFTRHPLFQVGGAVTLTAGVLAVALVTELDGARRARGAATAGLLHVAAVAPVVPMVLAVAWAAGEHWAVPALDVDAMARTHGVVNAVGFVGCGLVGYTRLLAERAHDSERTYAC